MVQLKNTGGGGLGKTKKKANSRPTTGEKQKGERRRYRENYFA